VVAVVVGVVVGVIYCRRNPMSNKSWIEAQEPIC
jgi:hypothetical protein